MWIFRREPSDRHAAGGMSCLLHNVQFKEKKPLKSYQSTKYKEHSKSPPNRGLASNISVAHGRHSNNSKVNTFPVGELLWVTEIVERVTRCLHLKYKYRNICTGPSLGFDYCNPLSIPWTISSIHYLVQELI